MWKSISKRPKMKTIDHYRINHLRARLKGGKSLKMSQKFAFLLRSVKKDASKKMTSANTIFHGKFRQNSLSSQYSNQASKSIAQ